MIKQFSIGFWLLLAIFGGELQASYTISTYAGTTFNGQSSGDGGPALDATFKCLSGLYFDQSTSRANASKFLKGFG